MAEVCKNCKDPLLFHGPMAIEAAERALAKKSNCGLCKCERYVEDSEKLTMEDQLAKILRAIGELQSDVQDIKFHVSMKY